MRSYGPAHWLDYYDMHAIMCAWYYTSGCIQQAWNKTGKCTSLHAAKYTPRHSQIHSEYAPSTPPSTFSSTLSRMLSRTLRIALDDTLSACLTIRSQVRSQDALKHTPEKALKCTPNCARWHTRSLLGSTLPSTLSRGKTLPISLDCMLPYMLLHVRSRDLQTCRRPALGGVRQVAYGGQISACGVRLMACGVWRVVGCIWWPKSWRWSIA